MRSLVSTHSSVEPGAGGQPAAVGCAVAIPLGLGANTYDRM